MYIILFSILASAIFIMAPGQRDPRPYPRGYSMPLRSQEPLYLMGYSSALNNSNITCVNTTFSSRTSQVVQRFVHFNWKVDGHWFKVNWNVTLYLPKSPLVLTVNLTPSEYLKLYAGAKDQYKIKYYNDHCVILGDAIEDIWVKPACSLWVKRNRTKNIPRMCKLYFESNCNDTHILDSSYWENCNGTS
uniref:Putative group viii salivary lipocalin n=1 Tax=Rhipicephalus pulchellus TaxID=72859 RepID=L7M9I1_RHIPC